MSWRNDPAIGAVPKVGQGTVDVGRRVHVGEAVVWDGKDSELLAEFLDTDTLAVHADKILYRKVDDQWHPVPVPTEPMVVVKPPAGDWFMVNEATFTTEFAIVVHVEPKAAPTPKPVVKKAPAKKAVAKKAVAKKAAPKPKAAPVKK
jgi:hypothetical protein